MRLSIAWIIASKDLSIFRKKKSIFYSVILFSLLVSIGLPLLIYVLVGRIRAFLRMHCLDCCLS